MRIVLYSIALISAFFLTLSAFQFFSRLTEPFIKGFNPEYGFDNSVIDQNYDRLLKKYNSAIRQNKNDADDNEQKYIWLAFSTAILTAGSTLVSSISAAKTKTPEDNSNRKYLIICAVLTFLSTATVPISNHFNTEKTNATNQATLLITKRKDFSNQYKVAAQESRPAIIKNYEQELEDLV